MPARVRAPIPDTLGEFMEARGLNQRQLAVLTGLTPVTISRLLGGKHRASGKTVVTLARQLGLDAVRLRRMVDAHLQPGFDTEPDDLTAAS